MESPPGPDESKVGMDSSLELTYVGGPTALLEWVHFRLLTDPTFDPAGGEYSSGPITLRKLAGPLVSREALGVVDHVLLSHDQHFDNLDHAGRRLLPEAKSVLTTEEGCNRLGGNSRGLQPWQNIDLRARGGPRLHVIGTPARHGPAGLERGPVTGFVLHSEDDPQRCVYFSGDTVWYEGVAEVAARFPVRLALLNLGAARVPEIGSYHLTMTAAEGVETARAMPDALIVPLHFEGWAHFSEGRDQITAAFEAAGLTHRLRWPESGAVTRISF
jgi:L-ascorbate metabolism protein UlaG (beta-lactamase superfamily)